MTDKKTSEKNAGRPMPPPRGRIILKYDEVQNLNISVFQLLDQMERNLQRRANGSDEEGQHFHQALENKIKLMRKENPTKESTKEKQDYSDSSSAEDKDPLLENLDQLVESYKKRTTDRKELQKLKTEIYEELRLRYITDEYIEISKEIEKQKSASNYETDQDNEALNSSIEDEDRILESTPYLATLRTSTYSASRKINQAEEKHKKLDKEIKTKKKILEEIEKQIESQKEEIEVKEQELNLKKHQLEQLH